MFLNCLNNKQKSLFIELAIKAAESNGIVELEEKNMLKSFAVEMNIKPVYHTDHDLESIIDEIKDISSEKELRIILFEILGIMMADSVVDEEEKNFIEKIVKKFDVDVSIVEIMMNLLHDYVKIYQEILQVVLNNA